MKYKKRHFYIENVSAKIIAKKFGTPSYVYSYDKIKNNINNFKKNFKTINPLICFSVKSNSNLKILNLINKFGLGADVVSKGELLIALKAKIKPNKIDISTYKKEFSDDNIKNCMETEARKNMENYGVPYKKIDCFIWLNT